MLSATVVASICTRWASFFSTHHAARQVQQAAHLSALRHVGPDVVPAEHNAGSAWAALSNIRARAYTKGRTAVHN